MLLVGCMAALAKDYTPDEIVNPNIADRRVYVADPGNLVRLIREGKGE